MVSTRDLKRLIGKPLIVSFLDHAIRCDAVETKAIGWLCEINDKHLKFCFWDIEADDEIRQGNNEYFSIVRNAITNIVIL